VSGPSSSSAGSQDTLIGGSGDDTLEAGSSGDDVIEAGTGNDSIDCGGSSGGGGGSDEARATSHAQVTVVGADSSDDSENSDCGGGNVDSADLEFQGVVNSTDGSSTMNITILDANDAAQAWQAANGDPSAVDITLTGASIEADNGGPIAAGDDVEVAANASGASLTAVEVEAQLPENSGFDD